MAAPEGYTKLGILGYSDKGVYDANATYNRFNTVYYEGSTYIALKDNLQGVTPVEGEDWRYMAKGFGEPSAEGIAVTDTAGIIDGTINKKTILQTFLDKVGEFIVNKAVTNDNFVAKLTERLVNNGLTTEEGFALDARFGKALQEQIDTQNSNLNDLDKRIVKGTAFTGIDTPTVDNKMARFNLLPTGVAKLYKSVDSGTTFTEIGTFITNSDLMSISTVSNCNYASPGYMQVKTYSISYAAHMPIEGNHDFIVYALPAFTNEDQNFTQMAVCTRSITSSNVGKIYTRSCINGAFANWIEK